MSIRTRDEAIERAFWIRTCESCEFRVDTPEYADKDHECRRFPPSVAGFPGVGLGTWCGEHKPRVTL